MATYTLTIDLTGFVYPLLMSNLIYENKVSDLGFSGNPDISIIASDSKSSIEADVTGGCIVNYVINNNKIIYTLVTTTDLKNTNSGDLVCLQFIDDENEFFTAKWSQFQLCPTCQDVTIDNCGSIIFEAAIPNGTYEVQIEDHQSGITYMQDIEFTGSQGTWDQTNTAGVFTPFSTYTVTILNESGDPVSWIDGTNEYTCMRLTFTTFTDTTPEG